MKEISLVGDVGTLAYPKEGIVDGDTSVQLSQRFDKLGIGAGVVGDGDNVHSGGHQPWERRWQFQTGDEQ